jgi:hypothetical protein
LFVDDKFQNLTSIMAVGYSITFHKPTIILGFVIVVPRNFKVYCVLNY